jgi:hypothetical protein
MKKLIVVTAVAGVLSACGTSGTNYSAQYTAQNATQIAQMSNAISQAPEWMSKLPKAPGYIFENGTATSSDFGFADIKAKTIAYSKICTAAGGKVRSQVKMYKADNGDTGTEQSEMAIRSICPDVDISGVETVEMKHVADGTRIRTYVLVALSTNGRMNKDIKRSAKEAFKELDEITGNKPLSSDVEAPAEVTPVPPVAPQKGQEVTVKRPDGTSSTLNLMPVDNAEYKARREEALKKPGAVIGQVSVDN